MALLTPEIVRRRLACLPDNNTSNTILENLIVSAQPIVEAMINSPIDEDTYVDYFCLDRVRADPQTGMYVLELKAGFVQTSGFAVATGGDFESIKASPQAVSSTYYELMAEKGLLAMLPPANFNVPGHRNGSRFSEDNEVFVKVTYTAGLDDIDDVPPWLVEVWVSKVIELLVVALVTEPKSEFYNMLDTIKENSFMASARRLRRHRSSMKPIF